MIKRINKTLSEFRNFAVKGNAIDMAVGIIIGAAFGKVVDSLVKDIIMPPLGWVMGKVDFTNLYFTFPDIHGHFEKYSSLSAAQQAGAVTINYGLFLNTIISFVIVAFAVFLLIKGINKLRETVIKDNEEIKEDTTRECPYCFSVIDKRATKCPNCTSELNV